MKSEFTKPILLCEGEQDYFILSSATGTSSGASGSGNGQMEGRPKEGPAAVSSKKKML